MTAQINYDELAWLDAYRKAIREQHPDTVVKMMIFSHEGVIAEQHEFTDLNILLVVKDTLTVKQTEQLRLLGYSLSDPPVTYPSIWTWTESEWQDAHQHSWESLRLIECHGAPLSLS
jgi:hypothetical protein